MNQGKAAQHLHSPKITNGVKLHNTQKCL